MEIKDIPVEQNTAKNTDYLVLQDPETGISYKITKANLFAGSSSDSGSGIAPTDVALTFSNNGDSNGLFYYLGTNKKQTPWANPAGSTVIVSASSNDEGNVNNLINNQGIDWYSSSIQNSWVSVSLLSNQLKSNYYSIKSRATYAGYYPRNWILQGSNNNSTDWINLDTQVNNTTLISISQWLSLPVAVNTEYSSFRILQTGLNSSGTNHFCLGSLELYGVLK